ncbi:hypothetical protein BBW65_03670 [Helicobacter enhydrae]|uniref:Ribosomal RNA small subunit methyltransferase G n=1 Tax=Helicobacter enhydrae TaxID=222136 RepID=A0A1B1U5E4_9HELI|nr:16S rRNA (guanine(527)-N(7))-methyltransferase RsmG [Helicobacter enhydrae]ANV97951.1 hypothetical protein BBW65_03670 [Helicobacter enhydrae]
MTTKLQRYSQLLLQWNQVHNLTGAKTPEEVRENITDCLYPLEFIDDFKTALDIGSGCGFPAIPLAIAKPQSVFYLTEPRLKRASFLKMLCIELKLSNVHIFHSTLQNAKIPQQVDLITSRAVTSTPLLIAMSAKHLESKGAFLFYKGSQLKLEGEEIAPNELFASNTQRIYFYRRIQC